MPTIGLRGPQQVDLSRMTLAAFIIELRRRAASMYWAWDGRAEEALTILGALALLGEMKEADFVRSFLAALVGVGENDDFDVTRLDNVSMQTMCQLDTVIDATLAGFYKRDQLRVRFRPWLLRIASARA